MNTVLRRNLNIQKFYIIAVIRYYSGKSDGKKAFAQQPKSIYRRSIIASVWMWANLWRRGRLWWWRNLQSSRRDIDRDPRLTGSRCEWSALSHPAPAHSRPALNQRTRTHHFITVERDKCDCCASTLQKQLGKKTLRELKKTSAGFSDTSSGEQSFTRPRISQQKEIIADCTMNRWINK